MSDDQGNPVLYDHEYAALKAMIEPMLAAEKKATEKPWHAIRQGRNTPEGWREWMDVWGPDGEPLIGCDENPMELRNVRNGDNDAEFIVAARNNFERIARMALRFAERACAAESAFSDLAESGEGVPFDRVNTYLRSMPIRLPPKRTRALAQQALRQTIRSVLCDAQNQTGAAAVIVRGLG